MGERRVQRSDDDGDDIQRTVNSQFGYQHKVQKDTTKMIKKLKMFNVFDPICKKCVKMGQQQSCREVSKCGHPIFWFSYILVSFI